jgi:hypothetical protein
MEIQKHLIRLEHLILQLLSHYTVGWADILLFLSNQLGFV